MAEVLTDSSRWNVSARSSGEVLAVRVGDSRLQVGLVGSPAGLQAGEVQGWLGELIGMATATSDLAGLATALPLPIPKSLHQALTGLLFLQSEVWGSPAGNIPLSLAVVRCEDRVAFGWSGCGEVTVEGPEGALEPAWITVRDQEGREARALVADGATRLSVRGVWTATGPAGEALEGVLEAEWLGWAGTAGEERPEPEPEAREQEAPERGDEVPAPPEPEALVASPPEFRQPEDEALAPLPMTVRDEFAREVAEREGEASTPSPTEVPERQAEVCAEASPTEVRAEAPRPTEVPERRAEDAPATGAESPGASEPRRPAAGRMRPGWHFHSWMEGLAEAEQPPEAVSSAETTEAPRLQIEGPGAWLEPHEPLAHDVPGVPESLPEPEAAAAGEPVAARGGAEPAEAPAEESPDGTAVADEAAATGEGEAAPETREAAERAARARRPEWPEEEERRLSRRLRSRRLWAVVAVVVVLFGVGWLLGHVDAPAGSRALGAALRAVGLGPSSYDVTVTSRPAGAWIAVDGEDQAQRTPATLALTPGEHEITLSLSGEGGSTHAVTGRRGERVALDVALWGALRIEAPPGSAPLTVAVDGMEQGFVPLQLDRLQPGIHRLQFTGPGVAAWEQTVEVHVNRTAQVLAQPVVAPPTGVLEVRARLADETGTEPLAGAAVRIDGRSRGVTPLRLELPRGPHSVQVSYGGEESRVQVIELPGGNQRFATLDLGLAVDLPQLTSTLPGRVSLEDPTVLSATLERGRVGDAREMWLHVRTPEGAWRRYPMEMMRAAGGLVGVTLFPTDVFDRDGRTLWYVSALAPTGDEYFTEIQTAQAAAR